VRNIKNVDASDYEPHDLAIDEFSKIINHAIDEHLANRRLMLFDTETIKFGSGGSLQIKSATDKHATLLLKGKKDEYLELQVNKLLENSLNQKIAAEILRQKLLRVSEMD
jgi:hypothetical protein